MIQRLLHYMTERQSATDRRRAGLPRPWSEDQIIATNHFCSVVRDDDRTSVEAREAILAMRPEDQERAVRVFRYFNWVPTLDVVMPVLGHGEDAIARALLDTERVYNSMAYRINTPDGVWSRRGLATILHHAHQRGERRETARETWVSLAQVTPSHRSPFIAHQVLQDMRWIHGPYTDEDEWCMVGVGAWRGLGRVVPGALGRDTPRPPGPGPSGEMEKTLHAAMRTLLETVRPVFPDITMMGLQHNLCEFDKYERVRESGTRGRRAAP